jgi:pyruvate-formate lyase-activating enzyme
MDQAAALAKEGKLTEIRTVVLGNYDGSEDCILRTAKTITGASGPEALHKISYKLIKYRPRGARKEYLKELKIPADKEMERLARIAADCGFSPVVIV